MLAGGSALALVSYGSLSWLVPEILKHRGQAEVYLRVKNIKPPRYVF